MRVLDLKKEREKEEKERKNGEKEKGRELTLKKPAHLKSRDVPNQNMDVIGHEDRCA